MSSSIASHPSPCTHTFEKRRCQGPTFNFPRSSEYISKPSACFDSRCSGQLPQYCQLGGDHGGCTQGIAPSKTRFGSCLPAARLREGASPASNATSSSVPALLVGAEQANQPAEGHRHLSTAKPSLHRDCAGIPPPTPLPTIASEGQKARRVLACELPVQHPQFPRAQMRTNLAPVRSQSTRGRRIHNRSEAPAEPLRINPGLQEHAWQPEKMDGNDQTSPRCKQQAPRASIRAARSQADLFLALTVCD